MKLSEVTGGVTVVKAPTKIPSLPKTSVFLAGSIEMDKAEKWQEVFTKAMDGERVLILNPRRDDWDSSLTQSIDDPEFSKQVNWELDALSLADWIVMYFDPKTLSPITLLELGLYADTGKLLVCCSSSFWRKGNVDIVCKRFNIPMFDTLAELIDTVKEKL